MGTSVMDEWNADPHASSTPLSVFDFLYTDNRRFEETPLATAEEALCERHLITAATSRTTEASDEHKARQLLSELLDVDALMRALEDQEGTVAKDHHEIVRRVAESTISRI